MKYYATQIGKDPEGAPTILQQVEVGVPLANYWEMRNVCDTNGNTYYSYGSKVGKITSAGVETTIDMPTVIGEYGGDKCRGIALDRDENIITMSYFYTGSQHNLFFHKILKTDFSLTGITLLKKIIHNLNQYVTTFQVDKIGNIWYNANIYTAQNTAQVFVLDIDSLTVVVSGVNSMHGRPTLDSRGYMWVLPEGWVISSGTNIAKFYYNGVNAITPATYSILPPNSSNYIDTLCWTNGTNYYLYALQNLISDITTTCTITKINITTHTNPTVVSTLTLTGLTDCYNLHTNTDGDIFFSTYGTVDGYNTYKIAHDDFTFDKVTNLYIAGLGSKTTGNDPYAFFVSQYGHTGANIN